VISPLDIDNEQTYREFRDLKSKKPALKTYISVGGPGTNKRFAELLKMDQDRTKLIDSAIQFMEKYGFDGIDLDWHDLVATEGMFCRV
jgi:chitinase